MKALKIAATALLATLILAVGLAAEALALARCTVLDADFYGKNEHAAYELLGKITVQRMADAVLEYAPAVALRTTDRQQAYALAMRALPPGVVADMLEKSGPDIARFLISGGDVPVLGGSREFARGEEAVVRGLLLDGLWDMLPQKPEFPAFMPFTPEWNLNYASALSQDLWLPRWYLSLADHASGLALSALVMVAGLLYLVWIRERKPFFFASGAVLSVNGLIFAVLAAAVSYYSRPIAEAAATVYPVSAAADLLAADFPVLVFAVLYPFRSIFILSAAVLTTFGITTITMGVGTVGPVGASRFRIAAGGGGKQYPKHIKRLF